MRSTFVIWWACGPAWAAGKTSREQAFWTEHAAFMDKLFADGMVLMGGPFSDGTGALVLVEAEGADEVLRVFAADPFVRQGIFVLDRLRQWEVFLDARRGTG